jgi:hypothetical protein
MHIDIKQQVSAESVHAACIGDSDRPILQCWEASPGVYIANHRACDVVGGSGFPRTLVRCTYMQRTTAIVQA